VAELFEQAGTTGVHDDLMSTLGSHWMDAWMGAEKRQALTIGRSALLVSATINPQTQGMRLACP
jgi:hypothetical protein